MRSVATVVLLLTTVLIALSLLSSQGCEAKTQKHHIKVRSNNEENSVGGDLRCEMQRKKHQNGRDIPEHLAFMDDDVYALLQTLTLQQKIGQMTQIDVSTLLKPGTYEIDPDLLSLYANTWSVGSFLNSPFAGQTPLNGPEGPKTTCGVNEWRTLVSQLQAASLNATGIPMVYGIDSVHGAHYVYGATIFPQQINAAASFNPDLVEQMGAITAKDTRAAGMPWSFAPILGISVQPLWPRVYETFGEDPFLASAMATAIVTGMQGNPINTTSPTKLAACMKHFVGYSNPRSGKDRTPSWIDYRYLLQYFVPSFRAAVQAGVLSTMESYNEINGIPLASSEQYLVDLLRTTLGFEGMLVTDYKEIENLYYEHHLAESTYDATRISMQYTSIDMSMVAQDPTFGEYLYELVQQGIVNESRVDVSAGRVLQMKKYLNLFDEPMPELPDWANPVGSPQDTAVSLQLATESIVLLENNGILPLARGQKVLVVGPSANSTVYLCGGWTIHWQGAVSDSEFVANASTTIYSAMVNAQVSQSVTFTEGFALNGSYSQNELEQTLSMAENSDVVVAVLGEAPYAELLGDIDDLTLPWGQLEALTALIQTGKPVVVVLVEGRPRVLDDATNGAAAVIWAGLPGPQGGQAIASILYGLENPSGRLPITYPSATGNFPIQYWHKWSDEPTYDPQWAFGTGLSYTTFEYSDLTLSSNTLQGPDDQMTVSVTITNTGSVSGKETVLLFTSQQWRIVTPEVQLLKGFTKVGPLDPNDSVQVTFTLQAIDLAFYGVDDTPQLQAANFSLTIGSLMAEFYLNYTGPVTIDKPCSSPASQDQNHNDSHRTHHGDKSDAQPKKHHKHDKEDGVTLHLSQQEVLVVVFLALVVGFVIGISLGMHSKKRRSTSSPKYVL